MKEEKKWCVYKHTSPSGKVYIGITSQNPKQRWHNGKGYLDNKHFTNAINKYGWDNFIHEIVKEDISKLEACELEKELINKYKSNDFKFGYNRSSGGENPAEGFKHTEESKEKISKAFKGRFVGELNPMYGVHDNHICDENGHLPKEIRDKLSIAAINRMKNDKNWSEQMQQYNIERMKPVNQYDTGGNFIKQFKSLCDAANSLGKSPTGIWRVCTRYIERNGSRCLTAHGYQWRYSDDCSDIGKVTKVKPKRHSGSESYQAKKIVQYSLDGEKIRDWECIKDAADYLGIHSSNISNALIGRNKTSGGYIWKYKDDTICSA